MLPFWTSYLIRTYAWMIMLRDNGVVNSILQAVGLTTEPIILLNTDFSVILGMTYGFLPFAILPLYVSIDRLDPALVAAARDLYASGRQAFLHVTLPLTMPGIIAAAILTFIPAIGDFVTPDLLGGAEHDHDRQGGPGAVPRGPRLAVRLGARVRPHADHPGRHVHRAADAAARGGRRMRRERNPLLTAYALIVYAFLFAPIVVLIVFSFNDSRRNIEWRGFTLDWYPTPVRQRRAARRPVDHAPGRLRRGPRVA